MQSTIYQLNNKENNRKVTKTNRLVKRWCIQHNVDYIDLNALFAPEKNLKAEFTSDGTYLKTEAYELWAKPVLEELKKLNMSPNKPQPLNGSYNIVQFIGAYKDLLLQHDHG